jgi:hypothetical protein
MLPMFFTHHFRVNPVAAESIFSKIFSYSATLKKDITLQASLT